MFVLVLYQSQLLYSKQPKFLIDMQQNLIHDRLAQRVCSNYLDLLLTLLTWKSFSACRWCTSLASTRVFTSKSSLMTLVSLFLFIAFSKRKDYLADQISFPDAICKMAHHRSDQVKKYFYLVIISRISRVSPHLSSSLLLTTHHLYWIISPRKQCVCIGLDDPSWKSLNVLGAHWQPLRSSRCSARTSKLRYLYRVA